nr:MAG TPA: hypothetical protein [Caudoviricetes sp.]
MNEKIVNSQAELDAISVDYNGRIIIKFGTPYNRAVVNKRYKLPVVAWENSSVVARGNSQVVDTCRRGNIKTSGNARIVCNPDNISDWAEANDITITDGKIRLYKAVHKRDGEYVADWDSQFVYSIGKVAEADGFTRMPSEDCGHGIHMATLAWSVAYGCNWKDIALLELETDADEVVVPLYETGKVRAPKALVIREVPLEEAGIMGKILAKRRSCKNA